MGLVSGKSSHIIKKLGRQMTIGTCSMSKQLPYYYNVDARAALLMRGFDDDDDESLRRPCG